MLVRSGFQGLQLVVTDFLPSLPAMCLPVCVAVAGLYGVQNEDLNISLTSIGLLVGVLAPYFRRTSGVVLKVLIAILFKATVEGGHIT